MSSLPRLNLSDFTSLVKGATQAPDSEMDLSLIDTFPQVRNTFVQLEELAESFRKNGIIEPLIVHEEPNGRYRLIVGERRLRAAPLAGLSKVPVVIKRGLSALQIRAMQVAENNDRDNLTPYDEAMGVMEDVDRFGAQETQKIWNRSEAWVSKRVAVKKYAAPVADLLKKQICGDLEVLHSLNQLYALSKEEFKALAHQLKTGTPLLREAVRQKVVLAKTAPKAQITRSPSLELPALPALGHFPVPEEHMAVVDHLLSAPIEPEGAFMASRLAEQESPHTALTQPPQPSQEAVTAQPSCLEFKADNLEAAARHLLSIVSEAPNGVLFQNGKPVHLNTAEEARSYLVCATQAIDLSNEPWVIPDVLKLPGQAQKLGVLFEPTASAPELAYRAMFWRIL